MKIYSNYTEHTLKSKELNELTKEELETEKRLFKTFTHICKEDNIFAEKKKKVSGRALQEAKQSLTLINKTKHVMAQGKSGKPIIIVKNKETSKITKRFVDKKLLRSLGMSK